MSDFADGFSYIQVDGDQFAQQGLIEQQRSTTTPIECGQALMDRVTALAAASDTTWVEVKSPRGVIYREILVRSPGIDRSLIERAFTGTCSSRTVDRTINDVAVDRTHFTYIRKQDLEHPGVESIVLHQDATISVGTLGPPLPPLQSLLAFAWIDGKTVWFETHASLSEPDEALFVDLFATAINRAKR